MLPKAHRLSTKQFDSVWKRGTSVCGAFVCIRIIFTQADFRCACIAPKKHARHAVLRNKLRRRLYGALRTIQDELPNNIHCIISPKNNLSRISHTELCADISRTLSQALSRKK